MVRSQGRVTEVSEISPWVPGGLRLVCSWWFRIDNNLNLINQESTVDIQNEEPIVEEKEISINFFGDLLIHNTVYNT